MSPAFAQPANTPDRTLAAEGDTVVHSKDGNKPAFHWKIWHLSDGSYEVVDVSAQNALAIQTYRFDPQLMPLGYTLQIGQPQGKPAWAQASKTTISCQYEPRKLSCETESSDGHKSEASIGADPPFICVGEFYGYDFLWLMTGVVRLAAKGNATKGIVNTYDWTEPKLGELGLEKDKPMTISFVGEVTGQNEGEEQAFKLYQLGQIDANILRVNSKGVVVSMRVKSRPESDLMTVANYKEYEPWAPKP
jgi:hypothetical protein